MTLQLIVAQDSSGFSSGPTRLSEGFQQEQKHNPSLMLTILPARLRDTRLGAADAQLRGRDSALNIALR